MYIWGTIFKEFTFYNFNTIYSMKKIRDWVNFDPKVVRETGIIIIIDNVAYNFNTNLRQMIREVLV